MWAFLMAALPLLGGFTQPIKDFFALKREEQRAQSDYKIAVLKSNTDLAVQNRISDSSDLATRIQMTSQNFKQNIYIWFLAVITFSCIAPTYAQQMWINFSAIPTWFTDLFKIMTLVTWGVPVAAPHVQNMFTAVQAAVADRREYKLKKLNIKAGFDALRLAQGSLSPSQVEAIKKMLEAMGINPDTGEQN